VTAALDDGPIIEQDVVRVSHRDRVEVLIEKGGGARSIGAVPGGKVHLDHRILSYGKTVVFD
jgi:formyltetrahydrofolate deformylase